MMAILKWQWLRYRRWVLFFALLHLILLLGMGQMGVGLANLPFYSTRGFRFFALGAIWIGMGTVLLGFSFGILQIFRLKRSDQWAFLIQRPLAHQQIYFGLAGFTLLALAAIIVIPWIFFIAGVDLFSEAVVDVRHYLNGFRILLAGFSAYLVATLGLLHPKKIAFLTGCLLVFAITFYTGYSRVIGLSTPAAILIGLIVSSWLFYLNYHSFNPNLSIVFRNRKQAVLFLVPVLIGIHLVLFFLLSMFSGFFINNQIPREYVAFPRNIHNFLKNNDPIPHIAPHLEALPEEQKDKWLAHLKTGRASFGFLSPNTRTPDQPLMEQDIHLQSLSSQGGEVSWRFSFDEMLFKGVGYRDNNHVGWLGPKGVRTNLSKFSKEERFVGSPKHGVNNSFEINGKIYNFRSQSGTVDQYQLIPEGQHYLNGYFENRFAGTYATKGFLYLVPPENYVEPFVDLKVGVIAKHPQLIDTNYAMILVEKDGEYLIRYGSDHYFGTRRPGIALVHVNREGDSELILEKEITQFWNASIFRYGSFIISPALYSLYYLGMWQFLDFDQDAHRYVKLGQVKLPLGIILSLVLLHLMSGLGTWLLARRSWTFPGTRIQWTLAATLLSLPVPVCFWFFREKQPAGLAKA